MENRENREQREELPKARIRLEFFRHDERQPQAEGQPEESIRLSKKGREHATEVGKGKNPKPGMSVAFGSPRDRSSETALRHMLSNENQVTPESTLEDIRALVAGEVKIGRKDVVSENLNFNWTGTQEYKDTAYEHYTKDKDTLRWIVEESDDLIRKLKDNISTSWSRQAGNVAELIKKYLEILPTWQRIVEKDPAKYQEHHNEMQRFFGSHQTVTESFLMKVIEKIEGRRAVRQFIESLPDKNGFGFSEGFEVDLEAGQAGNFMVLKYKDKQWTLTPKLIDEIIKDREVLDESAESKTETNEGSH